MVINDTTKLRLIRRETGESLMTSSKMPKCPRPVETVYNPRSCPTHQDGGRICSRNFQWPLRETSAQRPKPPPEDHLILCPSFGLSMATQYAQDSNTPEMVQAIFYAMVISEVAERGITCRISGKCLMWALQQLHWGPFKFWFKNVRRMTKTKFTPRIRSPDELLAKGTQGNPYSAPSSSKPGVEVASTSTNSISGETSLSSSDSSSRGSSLEGASTRSSSHKGTPAPGKSVLKRKGRLPVGLVPEIVAEGLDFPGALTHSDPPDGSTVTFPTPGSFLH
ncbi:hypothetical protein Cgig2_014111 [Carnegiea gigantea]|uniref:Uncharacterized protein n=1 Tax=Carnegiea gigantea TaxID=171969 RepID=A0A9Q1KX77_9CARY|nr:hypothetical protein Cgig2_014111 [Carnegiea gigantea]